MSDKEFKTTIINDQRGMRKYRASQKCMTWWGTQPRDFEKEQNRNLENETFKIAIFF